MASTYCLDCLTFSRFQESVLLSWGVNGLLPCTCEESILTWRIKRITVVFRRPFLCTPVNICYNNIKSSWIKWIIYEKASVIESRCTLIEMLTYILYFHEIAGDESQFLSIYIEQLITSFLSNTANCWLNSSHLNSPWRATCTRTYHFRGADFDRD